MKSDLIMKEESNKMGNLYINKKGQLEIGITMMVLLVFIILLFVSIVFYFRFTYENIKNTGEEILDAQYSVLLNSIMNMPELKCSYSAIDRECLDATKLIAFKNLIKNDLKISNYYSNIFTGVNKLSIEVIYPQENLIECDTEIGKYPYCNKFSIFGEGEEGKIYSIPVALYYPDLNKYKIAKLKIQTKT